MVQVDPEVMAVVFELADRVGSVEVDQPDAAAKHARFPAGRCRCGECPGSGRSADRPGQMAAGPQGIGHDARKCVHRGRADESGWSEAWDLVSISTVGRKLEMPMERFSGPKSSAITRCGPPRRTVRCVVAARLSRRGDQTHQTRHGSRADRGPHTGGNRDARHDD